VQNMVAERRGAQDFFTPGYDPEHNTLKHGPKNPRGCPKILEIRIVKLTCLASFEISPSIRPLDTDSHRNHRTIALPVSLQCPMQGTVVFAAIGMEDRVKMVE